MAKTIQYSNNWIAEAADSPSPTAGDPWYRALTRIYPAGPLTKKVIQDSLDAQYGKDVFEAWDHGSAVGFRRRK